MKTALQKRTQQRATRPRSRRREQLRFLPMAETTLLPGEVYGVGFAGIGGACKGYEQALGVPPYFACNHDSYALAIHKANHPETKHFPEDMFRFAVRDVVGRVVERGRINGRAVFRVTVPGVSVGLAHLSPDCRDHSRAKGGKPVSKKIRGLAWAVKKWAAQIEPRIIVVENVPEFRQWCGLVAKRDKATGRVLKVDGSTSCPRCERDVTDKAKCIKCRWVRPVTVAEPGERVPVQQQVLVRNKRRLGEYFDQLVRELRALGYAVEWRELRARDYGAPTSRKRLFIIARRDGLPILWPEATHAAAVDARVKSGDLLPFRTTAQCIDFVKADGTPNLGASIFGKKKPHAHATQRRVAQGVYRFVLQRRPFIVNLTHGGRLESVDEPATTITSAHRGEKAIVTPILTKTHSNGWDRDGAGTHTADEPAATLLAKDGLCLVAPTLIQTGYGERKGQAPRVLDIHAPLGTAPAQGQKHALVGAFLRETQRRSRLLRNPSRSSRLTRSHRRTITLLSPASLIQQNYGSSQWQDPETPINTLTQSNHHAVVSAGLAKLRGTSSTADIEDPSPTISAQGQHLGLITAQVTEYYGNAQHGHSVDQSLPTVTTRDRFALVSESLQPHDGGSSAEGVLDEQMLARCARVAAFLEKYVPGLHFPDRIVRVEIDGAVYVIVDIFMRMLAPRELARCQGFDDDFVLFGTVTQQVGGIGNSVPPPFTRAIALANTGHRDEPEEIAA